LQSVIIFIASINIKLIKPSTKTRQGDNFNIVSKRHSCFIKLPPLFKIKILAYKDIISKK
jgi:hypothetical protein